MMDMAWIYVPIVLLLHVCLSKGQHYYISKGKASAENASTLCKVATPKIQFFRSGRNTEISGIDTDEPVWVGYARTYKTFLYKGCVKLKQLKIHRTAYTWTTPGECFSFCQTRFIGMLKTANKPTCYCINDLDASTNFDARCYTQCEYMPVLCGNGTSQDSVTVYEHVNVSGISASSVDKEDSKCLAYQPKGSLFWSTCKTEYTKGCGKHHYECNVQRGYPNESNAQQFEKLKPEPKSVLSAIYIPPFFTSPENAPTTTETTPETTKVPSASPASNLPTETPTTDGANETSTIKSDNAKEELNHDVPMIVVYAVSPIVLVAAAVAIGCFVCRMKKRGPKPDTDTDNTVYYVNTADEAQHDEVNQPNISNYETRLQHGQTEHQYADLAQATENNDLSNIYEVVI